MNLKKIRALRHVRRFNFHHCNKYQSVAEHSFFVGIMAFKLAEDLHFSESKTMDLVEYALGHDVEEAVTGDIGYLVKRHIKNMPYIEDLASKELGVGPKSKRDRNYRYTKLIEFLDCYELKIYCEEERKTGNMNLCDIERETWTRLLNLDIGHKDVKDRWLLQLEPVNIKSLPDFMSHEGE